MPIITIRGQLGSGAPEIGKEVAKRLYIDYVDREIIAYVAANLKRKSIDVANKEMPPVKLIERIREALSYSYPAMTGAEGVAYMPLYAPTWEIPLDDERYKKGLESVIKKLAESQSIVIRGRGSQFILKNVPEATHVLVVAPLELRVKRVMASSELDEGNAKKEVERFDSSRKEFTKKYFHADLEDPLHYDLVINTNHLTFDDAASIVVGVLSFQDKTVVNKSKTRL